MKFAVTLLISLLTIATSRADIIANGDFHDGKAHWKGDVLTSAGADNSDPTTLLQTGRSTPGLTINFNSRALWPHIYQTFNSRDTTLNYSLTFKVSVDYAPRQVKPDPSTLYSNNILESLLRAPSKSDLKPPQGNDFMLLVVDLTEGLYSVAAITPKVGSTDPQTVTGTLTGVPAHDEKVLYLVFNRGPGSATILNVALTPGSSNANPVDNTFPKQ